MCFLHQNSVYFYQFAEVLWWHFKTSPLDVLECMIQSANCKVNYKEKNLTKPKLMTNHLVMLGF